MGDARVYRALFRPKERDMLAISELHKKIQSSSKRNCCKHMFNDAALNSGASDIAEVSSSPTCCMEKNNCVGAIASDKMERPHSTLSNPKPLCSLPEIEQQLRPSSLSLENGSICKFPKLRCRNFQGSDTNCLDCIHILFDKWRKSKNCVVFDDKDRIMKIVLFILSLQSNARNPFLIVSTIAALSSWENEFFNSAPSVYTVVYSGSKETRQLIRKAEFFGDGDSVLFQVILSSPEAISEDLEALKTVRWEAVIVDDCLRSKMPIHFEQFKTLITEMRLVLFSGQTKDRAARNSSLLSFIGEDGDVEIFNGAQTCFNRNIGSVKESLSHMNVFSCRFVEYWVPVLLSDFQLEQYCSILLSNVMSLQSSSKNDPCGALRDVILSIRQCFDHPYIVDSRLEKNLTMGFDPKDKLNFEIKASGKLQLLDTILSEINNKGLRALILSRASSGKDVIGNILEDFMCLRFGKDSYERLSGGVNFIPSKLKQATLNRFNDKKSGRFVFLLENRNVPNIKLLSVDVVILFNSDLNPLNDLRAIQKITFEQTEQIKLFRLYYPFTIEEKAFIQFKQSKTVIPFEAMSRSASQQLLMWGASYLFKKLDEFHDSTSTSPAVVNMESSSFNNSVKELSALLSQPSDKCNNTMESSSISKVHHTGGSYNQYNIVFPGELEIQLTDEKRPHLLWAQLLQGRHPKWKYISEPSVRSRKRVLYTEETSKQTSGTGNHSGVKKRKKTDKGNLVSPDMEGTANLAVNETQTMPKSVAFADLSTENISLESVHSSENRNPPVAQSSLHLHLKPELSKLCDVLQFSADAKVLAGSCLDYTMHNLVVTGCSVAISHALLISLCWIAASKLRIEIDHENSIVLARQHLDFCCKIDEVETVSSKLRENLPSAAEHVLEGDIPNDPISRAKDNLHTWVSDSIAAGNLHLLQQDDSEENEETGKTNSEKTKKLILEKYNKGLELREPEEIREFENGCGEKNGEINKLYRMEVDVILKMYRINSVNSTLLRHLDKVFAAKREEHERKMTLDRKNIIVKQVAARNDMHLKMDQCLHKSGILVENCDSHEKSGAPSCVETVVPMSEYLLEEQTLNQSTNGVLDGIQTSNKAHELLTLVEAEDTPLDLVDCLPRDSSPFEAGIADAIVQPEQLPSKNLPTGHIEQDSCTTDVLKRSSESITNGVADGVETSNRVHDLVKSPETEEPPLNLADYLPPDNSLFEAGIADAIVQPEQLPSKNLPTGHIEQDSCTTNVLKRSSVSITNGVSDGVETSNRVHELVKSPETEEPPLHLADYLPPDNSLFEAGIADAIVQPEQLPSKNLPSGQGEQESLATSALGCLSQVSTVPPLPVIRAVENNPPQPVLPKSPDLRFDENLECSALDDYRAFSHSLENSVEVLDASVPTLPGNFGGNQNTEALTPLVGNYAGASSNQTSLECVQGFNDCCAGFEASFFDTARVSSTHVDLGAQISQPLVSQTPPSAASFDPFQFEIERLQRETDKAKKTRDDQKLELKNECEKEIEEVSARIRSEYESKSRNVETAFYVQKKDLDTKQEKIRMHKILAEAFKYKCSDRCALDAERFLRLSRAVPTITQQHQQARVQQYLPRGASFPSLCPPGVSLPPIQTVHQSASYSGCGGSIRSAAPHLQFRPPSPAAPPPCISWSAAHQVVVLPPRPALPPVQCHNPGVDVVVCLSDDE